MKAVEITEVTLTDYQRARPRKDTWVLTHHGKPVAAVVPISSGVDLESFGLSHNPRFIEIVNRLWKSYVEDGGVSFEEMRRRRPSARRSTGRRKPR